MFVQIHLNHIKYQMKVKDKYCYFVPGRVQTQPMECTNKLVLEIAQ